VAVVKYLKVVGSIPDDAKSQVDGSNLHPDEAVNLDSIVVIRTMSWCHTMAKLVRSMQVPMSWKVPRPQKWCTVYHASAGHRVRILQLFRAPPGDGVLLHYACGDEDIRLQ
jgi:hypothetical protein